MQYTWTSLAISDAILAFSSFFGVFLMTQSYRLTSERMPVTGVIISFLLVGISAILGTLHFGLSSAWAGPHNTMTTAAKTLAPPLLALSMAEFCWKLGWSRPAWWRLLIGLMAGFELCRQSGYHEHFITTTITISLIVTGAAAVTMLKRERFFGLFMIIAVAAYGLAALVIGTEGSLAGYLRLDLYRYLLALGNLFAASGIFIMLKQVFKN
ncbi:hypothetical protein [Sansalvadorimonas verongulae]|uniref:hypothetical protein n=1 Tax=Sansalvadorimonas verongulae TaxID=2172824 RepID=UPI0012BBD3C8|nr:hypothetical protein [Sansalvadorimonas verongulae]MTI14456.1 hypothetical protein [Sansalvadorimonas verongulae]